MLNAEVTNLYPPSGPVQACNRADLPFVNKTGWQEMEWVRQAQGEN
jgi:hypothetical protein